uniref:Histidine kinase n=1 Tax=Steinernema glaseri TaxID=37863 RepID=A0A1I8AAR7_9BILA
NSYLDDLMEILSHGGRLHRRGLINADLDMLRDSLVLIGRMVDKLEQTVLQLVVVDLDELKFSQSPS